MAVGDGAEASVRSYVAVGKETTFGTYTAPSRAVEALSCGFMTEIEIEKIDAIGLGNRGFQKRVQKDKKVMGSLEANVHPQESPLLFAVALGGGITSALNTTGAYLHSLTAGNFDTSPSSVCFNVRKGSTHTFRYSGGRVNQLKITAAVNEVVRASYDFVFKDSTATTSDDLASALSISSVLPFVYVDGTFRYAATEANAATTTAAEPIQAFELTISNGLVSDAAARALGSNVLQVLPATRRSVEFKITQRFDTITAYNRFIQATTGSVNLFFRSSSIGSTNQFYEMTIVLPKVIYDKADVELKDTGSILQAEIPMSVLVDNPNTTTGRDIAITFGNDIASY